MAGLTRDIAVQLVTGELDGQEAVPST